MTPAVSIVMPVHNQAAWLRSAIESVRRQQRADWELLIVNDGSTDESGVLADTLAAEDPLRIRCLAHPGGKRLGAAASRNLAIAVAHGAYLAFLDADDLYAPEKLAFEVEILDQNPRAAMLYGPALWRWQDGSQPDRVDRIGIECGRIHNAPELVWRVSWISRATSFAPAPCCSGRTSHALSAVSNHPSAFVRTRRSG